MSRILKTNKTAQIGCMYLEQDGIIGYHEAVVPQLLLIVHGEGWVKGGDHQTFEIKAGDAVFWHKGEGHETKTQKGLMAIVIESEELNPGEYMQIKEKNY